MSAGPFLEKSTQNSCVICFEKFTTQRLATLSVCGHIFCFQCLFDWSSKKEICPICDKSCAEIHDYLKRIKKFGVNWYSLVENNSEINEELPKTEYNGFVNEITDENKNSSMIEENRIEMELDETNDFNNAFEEQGSEEEMEDICETMIMTSIVDFDYTEFD